MSDPSTPTSNRHDPPAGWPTDVFDAVTDALARILVRADRREQEHDVVDEREEQSA